MKLVIPYQIPFLAKEVGAELTEGVYAATDFWWTLEDKYPLAKMFVEEFEKKYGYKPEWGAENAYMQFAHLGAHGVEKPAASIRRTSSSRTRRARRSRRLVGDVHFRAGRPPAASARSSSSGQGAEGHEEQGRLLGGHRGRAGRAADAEARRVRLQARRLHLT